MVGAVLFTDARKLHVTYTYFRIFSRRLISGSSAASAWASSPASLVENSTCQRSL